MKVTNQAAFNVWAKRTFPQSRVLKTPDILIELYGWRAGPLLSQMLYWTDHAADAEGWFPKTREEWQSEMVMSRWEVTSAITRLVCAGVLEKRVRKISNHKAPCHYRVAMDILARVCIDWYESTVPQNPATQETCNANTINRKLNSDVVAHAKTSTYRNALNNHVSLNMVITKRPHGNGS